MLERVVVGFAALILACSLFYAVFSHASASEVNAYAPVQAENAGARAMALAAYQNGGHLQSSSLNVSFSDGGQSLTESLASSTLKVTPSSGTPWTNSIGAGAPLP